MMVIDAERYSKYLEGFFVRDATFGISSTRVGFLLVETPGEENRLDEGWRTRLITFNLEQPIESRVFSMTGNSLSFASLACAWDPNQPEYVAADVSGRVWSYKPKTYKGDEPKVPFDGRGYGYQELGKVGYGVNKLVRIGTTVFAVGAPMRIWERIDGQQWREHKDIPIPDDLKLGRSDDEITAALSRCPLNDLAGPSSENMYAVGAVGTVWRRQGGKWRQIVIPTNLDLHTVAVSPDDVVYITDLRGSIWVGRGDEWERAVKANNTLPYQDSVWFDNRLWCTNDSAGCFVLEGKTMVAAHQAKAKPMPAQVALHAHRLDVSPDGKTLLIAGMHGATLYDGNTWNVLFDGEPDE